jgi:hypothetical protein
MEVKFMKKALLISALVLTIVASMVSGTLAVYTRTLTPYSNDVLAKEFRLVSVGTTNFDADVLIAPTENVDMVFTVSNTEAGVTSEVDMDLDITVTFAAAVGKSVIVPLTATVSGGSGTAVITGSLVNGVGVFTITDDDAFVASVDDTLTYTISIDWTSTATDTSYAGHTFGTNVAVSVTGTQVV